jgi:hypothetical protein
MWLCFVIFTLLVRARSAESWLLAAFTVTGPANGTAAAERAVIIALPLSRLPQYCTTVHHGSQALTSRAQPCAHGTLCFYCGSLLASS